MPRVTRLIPSLVLLSTLLLAGSALSAVRTGTTGNDTLVGTKKNDRITGLEGDDILIGKGGNDVYLFADNFGSDTLVEKSSEGRDTVDFHSVTTGPVTVDLISEWVGFVPDSNTATGPGGDVAFAFDVNGQTVQSVVENAIGGQGSGDKLTGGSGKNVLQPGGGATDELMDVGGYDDDEGGPERGNPDIPVSNDVYKGFASNTGTDLIEDFGGNGDVLDLRPFATGDVIIDTIDLDNFGVEESLQIVTGLSAQVLILGQVGPVPNFESSQNYHGRIETIRFANKTFTSTSALQSVATTATAPRSAKQARLAEVADGLAEEARARVDPDDPLGFRRGRGE